METEELAEWTVENAFRRSPDTWLVQIDFEEKPLGLFLFSVRKRVLCCFRFSSISFRCGDWTSWKNNATKRATCLLVYQVNTLKTTTVPQFISNSFPEKKIVKT